MKVGFTPITLKKYVKLHLKCNKGERRQEVTEALQDALEAYKEGITCAYCGQPIWVIGSAFVGPSCFTCITGEAFPDDDYEIAEAC